VAQLQLSDSSQHTVTFVSLGDCSTACVDEKIAEAHSHESDNAIKYSPWAAQLIWHSPAGMKVIFQIKDEGIPAADQHYCLSHFIGRNVGDIPGTGLGLALSKAFDIHGGQITVASVVGVGTTFTITLPLGSLESGCLPLISTDQQVDSRRMKNLKDG